MKALTKLMFAAAAGAGVYALVRRARQTDLAAYYGGKAVIVTGGASGIGLAIVNLLRSFGANVLAVDIDGEALESVAADLPGVATLQLDLAERDAGRHMIESAIEHLGDLDIVFSNAGIVWAAPFLAMTDADIDRQIEVNLSMQVRLTRDLVEFFRERGGGVIAYTGSLSAYVYSPMHSVYTGTKGGLNNFVHSVRRELAREAGCGDIQLTVIHPNMTRTGLVAADLFDEVRKTYWLQTPHQVAHAFLQGVADGRREVFVELTDHGFVWGERLMPSFVDLLFEKGVSDEMLDKAEAAIPESKLRKQIS